MKSGWPLAIAIPVLVTLGWLSAEAYRLATAASVVGDVSALIEAPRKPPLPFDDWLALRSALVDATRVAPDDPSAFEVLGILHSRRSAAPSIMAYARDYYVKSLELRPSHPYVWANLAEAKYYLGEVDRDFSEALAQAMRLGPWEPGVQQLSADLGLINWEKLTPSGREATDRAIANGMRRDPVAYLQLAERRGHLDVACGHAKGNRRLADHPWRQRCG